MRNITEYANRCIEELNAIGIYPNTISKVEIDKRKCSAWGTAYRKSGVYSIKISSMLVDERISDKALRETLFHELLHCVDGCMNHGDKWTRLADMVSDCYNLSVKRTNSIEEKAKDHSEANVLREIKEEMHPHKTFTVCCVSCGNRVSRVGYRAPKWYVHPNYYKCNRCKGGLIALSC